MRAVHTARKLPNDGVQNGWYDMLPQPDAPRRVTSRVTADWGGARRRRPADWRPPGGSGNCGRTIRSPLSTPCGSATETPVGMRASCSPITAMAASKFWMLPVRPTVSLDAATPICGIPWKRTRFDATGPDWGRFTSRPAARAMPTWMRSRMVSMPWPVPRKRMEQDELEAITGSRFYTNGVHVDGAALVQPAAMMRGLGATLPANVTLYEDSPVTELHTDGDKRLICPDGEIVAKQLILTNHVFAEEMGFRRHRVVPPRIVCQPDAASHRRRTPPCRRRRPIRTVAREPERQHRAPDRRRPHPDAQHVHLRAG